LDSPSNFAATNNLALALCEEVDPVTLKPDNAKLQRALEYARQNYEAHQNNADACSTYGWVLFKKKEYDQAIIALRGAVNASGGALSPDTFYYLAMVEDIRNNKAQAKQIVEQIMKTERPFSKRKAARELLAKLEKEVPATPPTNGTPTSNVVPPSGK